MLGVALWVIGELLGGFVGGLFDLGLGTYALALFGAVSGAGVTWMIVQSLPQRESEKLDASVFE